MDTFFKMTLLVVAFGFLNGVVFLPVLLAIFGPVFDSNEAKSKKLADELENSAQELIRTTDTKLRDKDFTAQ